MHDQFGNFHMPLNSAEILGADDDLSIRSIPFPNQTVVSMATERGDFYRSEGKSNQDRVATGMLHYEGELITLDLVCDGLGGYEDVMGDRAAQLCCEALVDLCEQTDRRFDEDLDLPLQIVKILIENTLEKYQQANLQGIGGTTMTLAVGRGSEITLFNLGDSPGMVIDPSAEMVLLRTEDHKPTAFEDRFRLTRYLHLASPDELLENLSIAQVDLRNHAHPTFLILCSDGVTDNLKTSREDQDFTRHLLEIARQHGSTEELCEALMKAARERTKLHGTERGYGLDVKPDNMACLVRFLNAPSP